MLWCDRCDPADSFKCKRDFNRHLFSHHGVKGLFQCDRCQNKFNNDATLRNHRCEHDTVQNCVIPSCDFVGPANKMKLHYNMSHQRKYERQCPKCKKTLMNSWGVSRHLAIACVMNRENQKRSDVTMATDDDVEPNNYDANPDEPSSCPAQIRVDYIEEHDYPEDVSSPSPDISTRETPCFPTTDIDTYVTMAPRDVTVAPRDAIVAPRDVSVAESSQKWKQALPNLILAADTKLLVKHLNDMVNGALLDQEDPLTPASVTPTRGVMTPNITTARSSSASSTRTSSPCMATSPVSVPSPSNMVSPSGTTRGGIDTNLREHLKRHLKRNRLRTSQLEQANNILLNQRSRVRSNPETGTRRPVSCLRSPPFKHARTRDVPLTPLDTTKSILEVTMKPRQATKPTFELTVTPRDVTVTPRDVTKSPRNVTVTPRDVTATPRDVTVAPRDVTVTPRDVTKSPRDVTVTPRDVTVTPPLRSPGFHIKQEMEDSPADPLRHDDTHDVMMSAHDVTMAVRGILLPPDDTLEELVKTEPASIKMEELDEKEFELHIDEDFPRPRRGRPPNSHPTDKQCPLCQKLFSQPLHLKRHIKSVHEHIRDNLCTFCGKAFMLKSHLMEHIRAVHFKIKNHTCPTCKWKFNRTGDLNRHIKNIHVEGKKPRKRRVQQVDWQADDTGEYLDHSDNMEHSDTPIDVVSDNSDLDSTAYGSSPPDSATRDRRFDSSSNSLSSETDLAPLSATRHYVKQRVLCNGSRPRETTDSPDSAREDSPKRRGDSPQEAVSEDATLLPDFLPSDTHTTTLDLDFRDSPELAMATRDVAMVMRDDAMVTRDDAMVTRDDASSPTDNDVSLVPFPGT